MRISRSCRPSAPGNCPEMWRRRMIISVVDGGGDADEYSSASPSGSRGRKPAGKFLGDEGGGQLALAPARMLHDRGEERDVVADALDGEGVERVGLRVDRRDRASAPWVTSLAIIGS